MACKWRHATSFYIGLKTTIVQDAKITYFKQIYKYKAIFAKWLSDFLFLKNKQFFTIFQVVLCLRIKVMEKIWDRRQIKLTCPAWFR